VPGANAQHSSCAYTKAYLVSAKPCRLQRESAQGGHLEIIMMFKILEKLNVLGKHAALVYTHTQTHTRTHTHMRAQMHACTRTLTHRHTRAHTHTHTVRTHMHMHMHTCMHPRAPTLTRRPAPRWATPRTRSTSS